MASAAARQSSDEAEFLSHSAPAFDGRAAANCAKGRSAEMRREVMRAQDVMTKNVATVSPSATVPEVAHLLLERNISAAPVVDEKGKLVGIVSEGDFLRRHEIVGRDRRSWWLQLLRTETERAQEYTKTHSQRVEDVMTRNVVTVREDTQIAEIARILEGKRIKRVPVLRDGKIVGIVSRADLLRALAVKGSAGVVAAVDAELRQRVLDALEGEPWGGAATMNVLAEDGVISVWGYVNSPESSKALRVAVENVPGVRRVELHVGTLPAWAWAD
jgi:CBS domain-containing protein